MKIAVVLGCAWAAVLVAAATLVNLYTPLRGQVEYVLFFMACLLATWYGGAWAGVVAAVLSCMAIDYFFLPPVHSFFIDDWHDRVRLAVFLAGVAAFNYMIVSDRQAKKKEFWQHQQALRMLADRYLEADKGRKTSEALFRLLVDALPDHAVIPLDDLGHVAVWNQRAAQVTGYPAEQVIGQDFTRLCPGPGDQTDGPADKGRARTAVRGMDEETWSVRGDGSRFRAHVVLARMPLEPAGHRGYLLVIRDLSGGRQAVQPEQNAGEFASPEGPGQGGQ